MLVRTPSVAFLGIVALVSFARLNARPASALEPSEIYERWGAAVVTVTGSRNVGSGFAIPPTGYILTNAHVIRGESWLEVILPTGERRHVASVVMEDPSRDLAVLSVAPAPSTTVVLGDSDAAKVGERVVVIGSPRGLRQTVTDGILSQIRSPGEREITLLQTTAPISPGSSGGPLFNDRGEVIGIVSFSFRESQNLNFAVGINEVKKLLGIPLARGPSRSLPARPQGRAPELSLGPPRGVTIHLWNGSVVSARSYEETGDTIVYERPDGRVTVPRTMVARIIHTEDGTVNEITRTPPIAAQGPRAEKKTDIQELIARPRPSAPAPAEAPPLAPNLIAGPGACAQNLEDFSKADRQVVAPNVVRFKHAGQWILVEIRGLHPAEIPAPQDAHYLDQVLSGARQITLANRGLKAGGRHEATVCVDGNDVAEHPNVLRFRMRQPATR